MASYAVPGCLLVAREYAKRLEVLAYSKLKLPPLCIYERSLNKRNQMPEGKAPF